jgi:hypothetical protein
MRRFLLVVFGVLALACVTQLPALAMTFRTAQLSDAGTVIVATGQITETTPGEFLEFLRGNYGSRNLHAVVFLDSPGGRVLASMEFGSLLRKIGAAAVVAGVYSREGGGAVLTNGQCFSACVYAFMGARKRVVPASSQIGIHRMFAYEQNVDASGDAYLRRRYDDGEMGLLLKHYSTEMGVNPELISLAEHIPSDALRILSRNEIRRYRLGVSHL